MSARLRCFLLSTILLMMVPAAFADTTIVNFDFGAVPIACSNGYAYQGVELSCPYTGPSQNFNSAPGFGWTLLQGQANGLTGPGTVFYPPPFTGLPFTQAVFLQGQNSSVSQAVGGFLAGSYTLSFYLGSRFIDCCGYDGNQTVQALIDGNVIGTWALTSFTPFALETVPFTVSTGGTHTLEFRGINYGDHTAFLSYVSITPAGEMGRTWDATKDFAASNPNGAWSYGYGITGTLFTLDPFYNPDCADIWGVSGVVCWTAETYYDHTPLVSFNTTGSWLNFASVVDPPDVLIIHPGHYEEQDSIVRWTAPVAGYYNISGFFEICDVDPTGIIGLVFRNGTLLYSGELLGPPAQHPDQVGGRENFYFSTLFLNAGDVISFGVNSDGLVNNDSTGFNATITRPAAPCALCAPPPAHFFAYVTNSNSSSVSVIDTASNSVVATVGVGGRPIGVGITPDGSRAYVANSNSNSVSVINTASNTVVATVGVGSVPQGLAITPDGSRAYVANSFSNSISVINTASNTLIATVGVEASPTGVAITPAGTRVYVTDGSFTFGSVSVIDTLTNTVVAVVPVGSGPIGVAITPDGSRAYVANTYSSSVSVIDTSTNTVIATIGMFQPVGVAVTPDGTRVYVTNSSATFGSVSVIDTASNTVIATVGIGPDAQLLAITPDGTHAYVTSFGSNSVFVIDTANNTVTATVGVGAEPVGVAITPAAGLSTNKH